MPSIDEIQNLILNVMGRQQVVELTDAIREEEKWLKQAVDTFGAASNQAFLHSNAILALKKDLEVAQKSIATTSMNTRQYQQGLMAASYAIQDFSSANGGLVQQLQSVSNNIPQILIGLGGPGISTGMVAAISTLTTVTIAAAPHMVEWVKSLDLIPKSVDASKTALQQLQERIAELEKRPYRIAVETIELDEAKRKLKELQEAQRVFEAGKEGKTVFEKAAGEQVKANLEGEGPRTSKAMEAVKQQIANEMIGRDPEARKAAADKKSADEAIARIQKNLERNDLAPPERAVANIDLMFRQREARKAEERRAKAIEGITRPGGAAETEAGRLRMGAEAGNKPNERNELAGRFRAAGDEGLAAGLEASTPEEMERQQAQEDAWANAEDRWRANAPIRARNKANADRWRVEKANRENRERELANPDKDPKRVLVLGPNAVRPRGAGGGRPGEAPGLLGEGPGGRAAANPPPPLMGKVLPSGRISPSTKRAMRIKAARDKKAREATQRAFNRASKNPMAHPKAMGPPRSAQAPAAAAKQVLDANAQLVQQVQAQQVFLDQIARGMRQQGAQLGANARRQQQDGDSFLPVTW